MSPGHTETGRTLRASVTVARGGAYGRVQFPYDRTPGRYHGGHRGNVTEFSRKSRRRLLNLLHSLNRPKLKTLPLFVTLTYPDEFPKDARVWKADLDYFNKLLDRKLRTTYAAIWKMELEVRKSGEVNAGNVAPHFHLLLFCDRKAAELMHLVRDLWATAVASSDERHKKAGTSVSQVRSWNGVISYAAKYMAKVEALKLPADGVPYYSTPGRMWGVWHREFLPIELYEVALTNTQAKRVRRTVRKFTRQRSGAEYQSLAGYVTEQAILRLVDLYDPGGSGG